MTAALFSAVWLGLLTAISPCPLATNVAAVGFLGRHASRPRRAMLAGLLYVLGRTVCYTTLAAGLSMGLLAAVQTSSTLGRIGGLLIGPVLIVAGTMMLGLIPAPSFGGGSAKVMQRLGSRGDLAGASLLGVLFALSFCPASAAIFFGGLLPLAAKSESVVWVPMAYGASTGVPVFVFALLLAGGSNRIGRLFDRVQQVEKYLRTATAILILGIGIYMTVRLNLGLL
ncbi:MAG: aromatic aminobenezylarsenical efflux permease ArsG family transporter [Phycisphaerales bacterium]